MHHVKHLLAEPALGESEAMEALCLLEVLACVVFELPDVEQLLVVDRQLRHLRVFELEQLNVGVREVEMVLDDPHLRERATRSRG